MLLKIFYFLLVSLQLLPSVGGECAPVNSKNVALISSEKRTTFHEVRAADLLYFAIVAASYENDEDRWMPEFAALVSHTPSMKGTIRLVNPAKVFPIHRARSFIGPISLFLLHCNLRV